MMSSQNRPSAWEGRCIICDDDAEGDARLPYCPVHLGEHEERITLGVDGAELDRRWRDTLAIWRGRPSSLDSEEDSALFRFRKRVGDWLLFTRMYQSRLPDWVAVDITTGVVARLVECGVPEALDHFGEVRPAAGQEMLSSRWGVREPLGTKRRSLADSVASADFPVYGLEGTPLNLMLRSRGHSASGRRTTGLSLLFAGPRSGASEVVASLRSYVHYSGVIRPQDGDEQALIQETARVLGEAGHSPDTRALMGPPLPIDRQVRIPQFAGPTRLYGFAGSGQVFHLSSGEGNLHSGFTFVLYGVTEAGLSELLECLTIVNDRDDLVRRYESELNARRPSA